MRGYLDRDDLTEKVVSDGWFVTGDIGVLDERGWLYLRGREREEINKGGMKVYPADIDAVIERFPATVDVCTFAFDEPLLGEDVGVAVVLDPGDGRSSWRFATGPTQHLARHQLPQRWYVLPEIPRTSRGKVNRPDGREALRTDEAGELECDETYRPPPDSRVVRRDTPQRSDGRDRKLGTRHERPRIRRDPAHQLRSSRLAEPRPADDLDRIQGRAPGRRHRDRHGRGVGHGGRDRRLRGTRALLRAEQVNSDFEIAPYRPELKDQVVALWSEVFHTDIAMNRTYLEWKYERNPYLPTILFLALNGDGRVVGSRGLYGTCWRSPGGRVVIPCADDFAIVEDRRMTGIATAINRVALEDLTQRGHGFVMNTGGSPVTVLQQLAMGWKTIGAMEPIARLPRRALIHQTLHQRTIERLRRIWQPGRFSRKLYHLAYSTRRPTAGTSFEKLDAASGETAAEPRAAIVVDSSPRPDEMAELIERLPVEDRIRHVRDPSFFEWRFEDPRRDYRFLFYEREGRLDGYLAIAQYLSYRPPSLGLHIVDWEGTSAGIRAELISKALAWGGFESGIGAWAASLSAESKTVLEEAGFKAIKPGLRARGLPCVLLRKLNGSWDWSVAGTPALDRSHWDIRLIDSMIG